MFREMSLTGLGRGRQRGRQFGCQLDLVLLDVEDKRAPVQNSSMASCSAVSKRGLLGARGRLGADRHGADQAATVAQRRLLFENAQNGVIQAGAAAGQPRGHDNPLRGSRCVHASQRRQAEGVLNSDGAVHVNVAPASSEDAQHVRGKMRKIERVSTGAAICPKIRASRRAMEPLVPAAPPADTPGGTRKKCLRIKRRPDVCELVRQSRGREAVTDRQHRTRLPLRTAQLHR